MNIEIFHNAVHLLTGIVVVLLAISNILIYRRLSRTRDWVFYLENDMNAVARKVNDIRKEPGQ